MALDASATAGGGAFRRGYFRAGALGSLFAGIVFLVVLFDGHLSLLHFEPISGDFYDVQARSLLHLHWDVPRRSLAVEGFVVHGKVYEYFGPFPAVLRMPVVLFTHRFDGRLGQLSMLVAFAVALVFTVRLAARVRPLVRGDDAATRGELVAVGLFVFVVGAGSIFTYLASRSWVYHEAEMWGVALTLGAFEYVVAFTVDPNRRNVWIACALVTAALLARAAVGLGAYIAMGIVFVALLAPRLRTLAGLPAAKPDRRLLAATALALIVPASIYVAINEAKFGTVYALPYQDQLQNKFFPFNRLVLQANHGTMTNTRLIPTVGGQYFRPDAVSFTRLFPWVTFQNPKGNTGSTIVKRSWTGSYTTTMPFLTVLGLLGLAAVIRPPPVRGPSGAALRAAVVGGIIGMYPTLTYADIVHRSIADFVPFGVITALTGLHLVLRWLHGRARPLATMAWSALGVLAVVSVWFNVGLGVWFGRLADFGTKDADRLAFVKFQYALNDWLPGHHAPYVTRGTRMPRPHHAGTVFILDNCATLYWSDGHTWRTLERSRAGGLYQFNVRFPSRPTGWQPLVVNERGHQTQFMAVRRVAGDRVQFALDGVFSTNPVPADPSRTYRLGVLMDATPGDALYRIVGVWLDGVRALAMALPNAYVHLQIVPPGHVTFGHADPAAHVGRFSGSLVPVASNDALCRKLEPSARQVGQHGSPEVLRRFEFVEDGRKF